MSIRMNRSEGAALITAYGDGGFRIAGVRHEGSVLIVNGAVRPTAAKALENITPESLGAVFSAEPPVEILLIGTGPELRLPPPATRDALDAAGVAYDSMDTGAAARTYNVLVAEERRVAVFLLAA